MVKKKTIKTWQAFLIWAFLLTLAYVYTGFKESAQFGNYATWLTLGLGAYTGKRLFQKRKDFNGHEVK